MPSNKKILMFCHRTPPYHGVTIMGDFVFNTLKKNKFDISYLNISLSSKVENEGKSMLLNSIKLFIIIIKYIYKIIFFNPKYIYITPTISDKGFYRDFFILELTRFLNLVFYKKNEICLHIHMRPYNVSKFQNEYLFKLFFRNTKVILLSNALLHDFDKDVFKDTQVFILHNVILPITNAENIQNSLDKFPNNYLLLTNQSIIITYLGHLIETKGYRRALNIARSIIQKNNKIIFYFFGEFGSKLDENYFFQFITDNELQNQVFYRGACNRNNIWNGFCNSHIMIFPSYSEAYPLTILESMSVGIPVVATNTGAVKEIIGDFSGLAIDFCNSESEFLQNFELAIDFFINNWTRNNSIRSINYFNQNWKIKNFENQLLNIFMFDATDKIA
jgi:glycosyltransferase involved in cell wall biosynthesis